MKLKTFFLIKKNCKNLILRGKTTNDTRGNILSWILFCKTFKQVSIKNYLSGWLKDK